VGAVPRRRGGSGDGLTARRLREVAAAIAGRLRASAPWSLPLLAGAAGALLAVTLLARADARVGPATVHLSARPSLSGDSTLLVPPFGSVAADTHHGPLAFRATLEGVDVPSLERLITESTRGGRSQQAVVNAAVRPLERQARRAAGWFLVRIAALGLAGGALGVVAFGRRSWRLAARTTLGGALATALLLVPTLASYDVGAFNAPRYQGALEYAPTLIGDVRTGLDRLATLRAEMIRISGNLNKAYAALGARDGDLGGATVRVLHVSDVHLNPAGFDLAERLAKQFEVAAVVDTGDMGTWGLQFEQAVPRRIARFGVPYLFVKGNHDNAAMVRAVAANANARVLDHGGATVGGIGFHGVADPTFSPGQGYRVPEFDALKERRSVDVALELDRLRPPADVLLVHDRRQARYAAGHVATVLAGHYHRFESDTVAGTRYLLTGSVGAAGPDGLRAGQDVPYQAEVLYFDPATRRPLAVDRITVRSLQGSFSVDRELLPEGGRAFTPAPVEVPAEATPRPGEPAEIVETPPPAATSTTRP